MAHEENIDALLQKYSTLGEVQSIDIVAQDFAHVTQNAPREEVMQGLSEALRSDATPSFGEMMGDAFEQGDAEQRAGMLNQLLEGAPETLAALGEGGLLEGAGRTGDGRFAITPEEAARIPAERVRQLAEHAESSHPSVVESMSRFYAEHPALVKPLGGTTLGLALDSIAQRRQV